MKIKEEFKGMILSKRIGGRLITFDINATEEKDYNFFYYNGFKECFETIISTSKKIKYKNDSETPIINLGSAGEYPSSNSDK